MPRTMEPREALVITNANKGLVVNQLDRLLGEWRSWLKIAQELSDGPDSPDYHPNTCTVAVKDGFGNRRKHETLREKTLVFIGNNFSGYGFLFANWPTSPHEANTERLITIIPGWIHRLETLSACIEYARVTDGFWRSKGKELVDRVVETTPDKAAEIAASFLKNPFSAA
jgi:hypothetical protein